MPLGMTACGIASCSSATVSGRVLMQAEIRSAFELSAWSRVIFRAIEQRHFDGLSSDSLG